MDEEIKNNNDQKSSENNKENIISNSRSIENNPDEPKKNILRKIQYFFGSLGLVPLTLMGLIMGIIFGLCVRLLDLPEEMLLIIRAPGDLFISALKLLVIPFIAIIMVRIPMDLGEIQKAKKIASKVLIYYMSTTFIASLVGLMFYNIIKPGSLSIQGCEVKSIMDKINQFEKKTVVKSILDIGFTAIPENLFGALTKGNILGVLTFFLIFGFILLKYKNTTGGRQIKDIVDTIYQVFMDFLKLVISLTPIGIFSLISSELAKLKSFCIIYSLVIYIATVISALLFHTIVVYQVLYFVFARKNPFKFSKHFIHPSMTAFATASSAAALPLTIKSSDKAGIDVDVSRFVLPLGATVNMDGSAVYYPITALFLASLQGIHFGIAKQIMLGFISGIVTIGGAPIPSGALVFLVVVLEAVGIPVTGNVSYIWAIDSLMDRCLTTTNIFGDAVGAGIINKILKKHSKEYEDIHKADNLVEPKKIRLSNSTYSVAKKIKTTTFQNE